MKRRKINRIGHILRRNCLLKHVIEGKIERKDRSDVKTRKKAYAATLRRDWIREIKKKKKY